MKTLFEKLKAVGLPIENANEAGEVSLPPDTTLTSDQQKMLFDIAAEHFYPQKYIEQKWSQIKDEVDRLLLNSLWTQSIDSGLSLAKRLEWQDYRDDLRSIRDDFENPDDVIFPTPPEEE